MEAITLDSIKQEQTRIADMIAKFEATNGQRHVLISDIDIELSTGEHYAGMILNEDGLPSHHLILLPEEATDTNWEDAKQWALEADGELPDRREQALLYANLKQHFESAWYWSSEQHASYASYAWCQHFGDGDQDDSDERSQLRARAVRRLTI